MKKSVLAIALAATLSSSIVHAFMPAPGLWGIDSELNGEPGRGLQIEVENGILLMSYYGYRPDGSSLFYLTSGPIKDGVFVGTLTEYRGGTPVGQVHRSGVPVGSVGTVTIKFSSGKHATISLPNEQPKAISKYDFGYSPNPSGLFGTYLMTYTASTFVQAVQISLTRDTGVKTDNGSGMVSNNAGDFFCENIIKGILSGQIICIQLTGSGIATDDTFSFKMAGDRGSGVGTWTSSRNYYPANVLRIKTGNGVDTGLNDGTLVGLSKIFQGGNSVANGDGDVIDTQEAKKMTSSDIAVPIALTPEEQDALDDWAQVARKTLQKQ